MTDPRDSYMVRGRGSDNLHAHSMSARWEARLPVVYIFYAEQSHGLQHWMWNSIRLTVRLLYNTTLITNISCATPHDLDGRMARAELHQYEHNRLAPYLSSGMDALSRAWHQHDYGRGGTEA